MKYLRLNLSLFLFCSLFISCEKKLDSELIDQYFRVAEALDESASRLERSASLLKQQMENEARPDGYFEEPIHNRRFIAAQNMEIKAMEAINYLLKVEKEVITKAGGINPETKKPLDMYCEAGMKELMVGTNKSGEGYQLQKKMNLYAQELTEIVRQAGPEYKAFKFDSLCNDFVGLTEADKKKDYANHSFGNHTTASVLLTLTYLRNEVRRYQMESIKKLQVNCCPPINHINKDSVRKTIK